MPGLQAEHAQITKLSIHSTLATKAESEWLVSYIARQW